MFKALTVAYQHLIFYGAFLKSPLLLLMRLFWGWGFMHSGWEKLQDIDNFAKTLEGWHVFAPYFNAYLVGYVELLGGLCLFLGFASRLAAIPLIIEMISAYFIAHQDAFASLDKFTSASPFYFLLTALIVLAFGPGRFSFDYMFERWIFHKAQSVPTHQHLPQDKDD